jgi:hypothetical protein
LAARAFPIRFQSVIHYSHCNDGDYCLQDDAPAIEGSSLNFNVRHCLFKRQQAKGQHVLLAFFLSGTYIVALNVTGF